MRLFVLEWDNGYDFRDRELTLLGIYLSVEERELAKVRYLNRLERYPLNRSGHFIEWDAEAGTDFCINLP